MRSLPRFFVIDIFFTEYTEVHSITLRQLHIGTNSS